MKKYSLGGFLVLTVFGAVIGFFEMHGNVVASPCGPAGSCSGAISVDTNTNNVSFGTSTPDVNSNMLVVGSSSANYVLRLASSSGSNLFYVDKSGTVWFSGAINGGQVVATNVAAGQFGANTGGGSYSFPSQVTWNSTGILSNDGNGAIELGPTSGTGNVPFIDFHYGVGSAQDYNVRLQNNGNNQFTIYTASNGAVLNVNGGNVGIGTVSPNVKLEVNGSVRGNQAGALRIDSGNGTVDIGAMNPSYAHIYTDRPSFYFNVGVNMGNGNVLMNTSGGNSYINSGNVGIGTTGPAYKLDVQGGQINASGGLCIAGDCKTAWNQVAASLGPVSTGAASVKTSRNIWSTGLYNYQSYNDLNAPTSYGAAVGFGAGLSGSGELYTEWTSPYRTYRRSLRDCCDNWSSWTRLLDASNDSYAANMNQNVRTTDAPTFAGATFNGVLNLGSSLVANRNTIYLAGNGDLNHAIGNGLESYFATTDGETFYFTRFLDLYGHGSGSGSTLFLDGASGNVGVGKTNPAYRLDANGQINASGGLCIAGDCKTAWSQVGGTTISATNVASGSFGANTGGGTYVFPSGIQMNAHDNAGYIAFNNNSTYWGIVGNYAPNDWRIGWGNPTGLTGWNLRWDASGNVFTNGNVGIPGTLTVGSVANPAVTIGNGATGYLQIGSTGWYDDGSYFSPLGGRSFYVRSNVGTSYIYSPSIYLGDGSSANNVYLRNNNLSGNSFSIPNSGNTYFNSGNVGIGTASPSQKLSVVNGVSDGHGIVLGIDGGTGYTENRRRVAIGTAGWGGVIDLYDGGDALQTEIKAGGNSYFNGNVGIGTTGPAWKLDVAGDIHATGWLRTEGAQGWYSQTYGGGWYMGDTTWIRSYGGKNVYVDAQLRADGGLVSGPVGSNGAGTLVVSGAASIGGKLTVGTIDPVYTIGGTNYATYVSGMTGQKEETTGQVTLSGSEAKYVIDFNSLEQGSDLWLFSKATDVKHNFDKMTILLTPSFNGKTWYRKDLEKLTLTIYGDSAGEVSYRLASPRFDSEKWTNFADPKETGFTIN